jgi:hypothetical protein
MICIVVPLWIGSSDLRGAGDGDSLFMEGWVCVGLFHMSEARRSDVGLVGVDLLGNTWGEEVAGQGCSIPFMADILGHGIENHPL